MQTTKIFNFKKPEYGDQAKPDPFNENFEKVEEAIANFDFLCDRYGYSFTKENNDNNTVYNFAITGDCPYTATKKVTKSIVDGVKQFRTEINIDGTITIFVDKKTANGWDGSVE